MEEVDQQVIVQTTPRDFKKIVAMIDKTKKTREYSRNRNQTSDAKRRPRKPIPEFAIISSTDDVITLSMTDANKREIEHIIEMVKITRERERVYKRKRMGYEEVGCRKLPVLTVIK